MHVVIVGGGFGGIKTALELSKRQVGKITLISDQSYFLHHATLYATATGRSTEASVIPLRTIFARHPNVDIVEDTITGFDPHRKLISSDTQSYHYDKLVLAMGLSTSFFGIKGLKQHAYSINTIEEVQEFHEHVHDAVVLQKLDKEYFVIGAGPTGVEMASALNEYLLHLKDLYRLKNARPKVTLVEAEDRVLPHRSKTASSKVQHQLKKQGVRILLNQKVTALEGDSISIDGRLYPTTTAVWTSGLITNPFFKQNAGYFVMAKNGRVSVNPYLEALEHVYVIGDTADIQYSGMALPTIHQARHVAKNIVRVATKRPQIKYRPRSTAFTIPVGEHWGYAEWLGLYVSGRSGGILRRQAILRSYRHILPLHMALPIWRALNLADVDHHL